MADDCRATAAPEEGIWEPLGEPVGPAGSSPLGVYRLSGCAFGEDALLLARFSAPRPGERVCDLGTGTGILPLYWHRLRTDAADGVFFVDAVEREPVAASLARRAVGGKRTIPLHSGMAGRSAGAGQGAPGRGLRPCHLQSPLLSGGERAGVLSRYAGGGQTPYGPAGGRAQLHSGSGAGGGVPPC